MGQVSKFAVPLAVLLLAGCMPESPRTAFDWGVNDHAPRRVASSSTAAAKTYTYQEKNGHAADGAPADISHNTASAAPVRKVTVTSQPLPPVGDAPVFAWPVTGPVLSDFGTTANGGKNDGINIAAPVNTPIHASASGTVTYAGDELKNYGNLVLVKHSGGFTTAYAHADRLIVSRGDFVARGQVIGYVGQTGDVSKPQLHFEIRSATTPVNPHSYLAAATASNSSDPR
ncbi:MAG TPA: M23 family metallopeptidase [Rhizomicrobium sp.]|nr:M23 family metallopeptidase [Rhizomicrobium sp.]